MTWQMTETRTGTRFRFNVATTSKGFYSWESTVEAMLDDGDPTEVRSEALKAAVTLHDELEAMLRERYGHLQDKPPKPLEASSVIKGLTAMKEQKP